MKSRKLLTCLALVILIVPVLTACGPTKIDVALTTYKIEMSATDARSGDIVFHRALGSIRQIAPPRGR